ncbi:Dual-specificity RNA methyltransferase RlmN [uncultured archaeon]|nr:Dual-specificity RNA methyltransferase RlmN [uncultured archaeon]
MEVVKSIINFDSRILKCVQRSSSGDLIETGFYLEEEEIICLSTQFSCPMRCIFCSSTSTQESTLSRNISSKEIVEQAKNVLNSISELCERPILFSFMGIGEPFLNYDNLVLSIKQLTSEYPQSRVTISTIGNNPELIKKLAEEKLDVKVNLHLSLHAPNEQLRKKILPFAGNIDSALNALSYFAEKKKVIPKINYVLIKDLNDSIECAHELAELIKGKGFVVKLSELNECNGLEKSPEERIARFEEILAKEDISTTRFVSTGKIESAGCGQLKNTCTTGMKNQGRAHAKE